MKSSMSSCFFFLFLAAAIGVFLFALSLRAKAMRALAARIGFQYTKDGPLPKSFCMTCKPFNDRPLVWNVLAGKRNGNTILVFDSVVGRSYRTVIAVQTIASAYSIGAESIPGRVKESDGWVAVVRLSFPLMGWGMGIRRIEKNLELLNI